MIDNLLAPYAAFILRVNLGAILLAHGLFKVVFAGLDGTVLLMERAGYFGWTAYPVMFGEVVGGAALIVGVFARIAAFAAIPILVGATLVHVGNGWFFGAPGGGWEYPVFLTFALLAQGLLGDGALTLVQSDRLLARLGSGRLLSVPASE